MSSSRKARLNEMAVFVLRRMAFYGVVKRHDLMTAFDLKEDVASKYMADLRSLLADLLDAEASSRQLTLSPAISLGKEVVVGKERHIGISARLILERIARRDPRDGNLFREVGIQLSPNADPTGKRLTLEFLHLTATRLPDQPEIDYDALLKGVIHHHIIAVRYVSMKPDASGIPVAERPLRFLMPDSLRLVNDDLLLNAFDVEEVAQYRVGERTDYPPRKSFKLPRFLCIAAVAPDQPVTKIIDPDTGQPLTQRAIIGAYKHINVGADTRLRYRVIFNSQLTPDQKQVLRREIGLSHADTVLMNQAERFYLRDRYMRNAVGEAGNSNGLWPIIVAIEEA